MLTDAAAPVIMILVSSLMVVPMIWATIVTPLGSDPANAPDVNVAFATPEESVKATAGDIVSPPPVGFSMENATGASPTTWSAAFLTMARISTEFLTSSVLGAMLEGAWMDIWDASSGGADITTVIESLKSGSSVAYTCTVAVPAVVASRLADTVSPATFFSIIFSVVPSHPPWVVTNLTRSKSGEVTVTVRGLLVNIVTLSSMGSLILNTLPGVPTV